MTVLSVCRFSFFPLFGCVFDWYYTTWAAGSELRCRLGFFSCLVLMYRRGLMYGRGYLDGSKDIWKLMDGMGWCVMYLSL